MENVPEVVGSKNIKDFAHWRDFLERLGYKNYLKVLNAKDYGIPQNRRRCFMVSLLGNYYYEFPAKIPLKLRLSDFLEKKVDDKFYLSQNIIRHFFLRKDRKNFAFRPKYPSSIASTITTRPDRPTENYIIEKEDKDYLNKLLLNQNTKQETLMLDSTFEPYKQIEPIQIEYHSAYGYYINIRDDFEKKPKKDLARTLVAQSQTDAVIYNGKIRKLTPLEVFRLMGFSDTDYQNCINANISNTQLYKQAGNSIVVNKLEQIFKMLF
ncbi:MAG: DNA (cytosine-5-)-methyltransferase [Firmicutes bacterium]|nr:DNA (cytosine-5-)-methyltransferase [Bacillota bacterium]